jgi:hypothetical protein
MIPKEETCVNCKFYREEECRRYPPQLYFDGQYDCRAFPIVSKNFWCGEYKEAEDDS